MDPSFWFDWDDPLYILRGHRLKFPHKNAFLLLKTAFLIVNSVDPDEMPHNVAFHLGTSSLFAKDRI